MLEEHINIDDILNKLNILFPNAKCELNYHNIYELSIVVILSAQTTDKAVNKISQALFQEYPTLESLANASFQDVKGYINNLGLANNKAKNIIDFSQKVIELYNGIIPDEINELIKLPGIGNKCANVIVSEGFNKPGLAVDTHVERVSKRLGLVPTSDTTLNTEKHLKAIIPLEKWHLTHHQLIYMGRYLCFSRNPKCQSCPFYERCTYDDKKRPLI